MNKEKKKNEQYRAKIKKSYADEVKRLENMVSKLQNEKKSLSIRVQELEDELTSLKDWNDRLLEFIDTFDIEEGTELLEEYKKSNTVCQTTPTSERVQVFNEFLENMYKEMLRYVSGE